jgi:hypothetical protein
MIHMVATKCLMVPFTILVGLPLKYKLSFNEGVGYLKIWGSGSEVLHTNSTALVSHACDFILLFSVVFCMVRALHKFYLGLL